MLLCECMSFSTSPHNFQANGIQLIMLTLDHALNLTGLVCTRSCWEKVQNKQPVSILYLLYLFILLKKKPVLRYWKNSTASSVCCSPQSLNLFFAGKSLQLVIRKQKTVDGFAILSVGQTNQFRLIYEDHYRFEKAPSSHSMATSGRLIATAKCPVPDRRCRLSVLTIHKGENGYLSV